MPERDECQEFIILEKEKKNKKGVCYVKNRKGYLGKSKSNQ